MVSKCQTWPGHTNHGTVNFGVPAFGRVQGDYGVEAFNVQWDVEVYELGGGRCWYHYSDRDVQSNAPTIVEGWRMS